MIRKLLLLLLFISSIAAICSAKRSGASSANGAIIGVILREDGTPAADFRVCTEVHLSQSGWEHIETCCPTRTDEKGHFIIADLEPGTYGVLAENIAEGYSTLNQSPGQSVTLTKKHLRSNVSIQLRHKGAVLAAAITDKETGMVIPDVNFSYDGVDCEAGGNVLRDLDGKYYLDIPTNCDVVIIARARGYKGWVYTDTKNPSHPLLRLAEGERKLIEIQLEPLSPTGSKR